MYFPAIQNKQTCPLFYTTFVLIDMQVSCEYYFENVFGITLLRLRLVTLSLVAIAVANGSSREITYNDVVTSKKTDVNWCFCVLFMACLFV